MSILPMAILQRLTKCRHYKVWASLTTLLLLGLIACSGGSDNPSPQPNPIPTIKYASNLVYTDPGGSGYRLLRGTSSTTGKLVLELRGPASDSGTGINFGIQTGTPRVSFVKVSDSDVEFVQSSVFQLGNTEPRLIKSVADSGVLRVSIAQKGQANARPLGNVLARMAVQLGYAETGTNILLKAIDAEIMLADGTFKPIEVAVGELIAE